MALYHKWDVKTGFTFALQFFMLISDGLGGVNQDYEIVDLKVNLEFRISFSGFKPKIHFIFQFQL